MSDWWNKKLGNQTQQPAGIVLPPAQPRPQPVQQQQPIYPQQQQQPQAPVMTEREQMAPTQEITMGDAIRMFKGGPAARAEGHLACPGCGSTTGYTHYSGTMGANGHRHRPHCFECGYNGAFTQGDKANWV